MDSINSPKGVERPGAGVERPWSGAWSGGPWCGMECHCLERPGAGLERPWSGLERAWSGPGALEIRHRPGAGLERPGAAWSGPGAALER